MEVVNLVSDDLSQEVIDLLSSSPPQESSEIVPLRNPAPASPEKTTQQQKKPPLSFPQVSTDPQPFIGRISKQSPNTPPSKRDSQWLISSSPLFEHERQTYSQDAGTKYRRHDELLEDIERSDRPRSTAPTRDFPIASKPSSYKNLKDKISSYLSDSTANNVNEIKKSSTFGGLSSTMTDKVTAEKSASTPAAPTIKIATNKLSFSAEGSPKESLETQDDSFRLETDSGLSDTPKSGHLGSAALLQPSSSFQSPQTSNTLRKRSGAAFKDPTIADSVPASETNVTKAATATSTITDRKKAAQNLRCHLWTADSQWATDLEEHFCQLESGVTIIVGDPVDIDGVLLIVSVQGTYEDKWDPEHQTFIKTTKHDEDLGSAIVVLKPEVMDSLGAKDIKSRNEYFFQIKDLIFQRTHSPISTSNNVNVLFIITEVGLHYKRTVDRFNRAMRRRVVSQSENGGKLHDSDDRLEPPNEQFYTDLESELQIIHRLRAHYPRKREDCIEMIANCVIDYGHQRYCTHTDQHTDTYGGSVRSKTAVKDIFVESLTKIQGLPPRIATNLANEMSNLGKLLDGLGSNPEMRASRVKRFGKGNWNDSLLKFLECDDPDAVI